VTDSKEIAPDVEAGRAQEHPSSFPMRVARAASFRQLSAVYVWAVLIIIFSILTPETFLTTTTWRSLLDQEAITAMLAIGLVVPLACGVYDLSVGYELGVAGMFAAWLIVQEHVPVLAAVPLTLLLGASLGAINGFLVVGVGINSFIATLATGSGMAAFMNALSGGNEIIGLPNSFNEIGTGQVIGVTLPVVYLVVLAVVLWYMLEYTPVGRRMYATGGNPEVARLAGVRTNRLVFTSLLTSAVIASIAGLALTATQSVASPDTGPSYLLPAFTAAFLGATQVKPGAFNIPGTVIAIYVLATGVQGLLLIGAPFWLPDAFDCVALILAVGLSARRSDVRSRLLTWRFRKRAAPR
jgi:ribose transport system permease protein